MRILFQLCLFLISIASIGKIQAADSNLDFHSALNTIISKNTSVGIQESQVKSAKASGLLSRTAFLPSVNIYRTEYKYKDRVSGLGTTNHQEGFNATWNLFRSGSDIAGWNASDADIESQSSLLKKQLLSAETDAAKKIFDVIQFNQQVEIAKKIAESLHENYRIAKLRFEKGLLPRQEVEKVYIDLVNAEARTKNAEIQSVESNTQLSYALGHNRIEQTWPWQEKFLKSRSKLNAKELQIDAVPGFKAASQAFEAESQRVKKTFRRMLPTVDATAYYNLNSTNYTTQQWSGALTVSLPIFDQLVNYSQYAAQVETRSIAELQLEQTRRDSEAEFKSAKDTFQTSVDTALARQDSLGVARRLYRDNEIRFKSGKITANDLIVDQNRLFTAEQFAVEGWNAAHLAFIRLCHALGNRIHECESSL